MLQRKQPSTIFKQVRVTKNFKTTTYQLACITRCTHKIAILELSIAIIIEKPQHRIHKIIVIHVCLDDSFLYNPLMYVRTYIL